MHALKIYREKFSLTQSDLGEIINLGQGSISNVERGRRKLDPLQVKKISEITGISKHELRPDLFDK